MRFPAESHALPRYPLILALRRPQISIYVEPRKYTPPLRRAQKRRFHRGQGTVRPQSLPAPEPAPRMASTYKPNFTAADLQEALQVVQQLDPPGVGCRDLRECLLAQLRFHQAQLEQHKNGNGTAQVLQDADGRRRPAPAAAFKTSNTKRSPRPLAPDRGRPDRARLHPHPRSRAPACNTTKSRLA